MPSLTGKEKKQKALIADLGNQFRVILKNSTLSAGDFPELAGFTEKLQEHQFSKFPKLKQKLMNDLEDLLNVDIPALMEALPRRDESPVPQVVSARRNNNNNDDDKGMGGDSLRTENIPQVPVPSSDRHNQAKPPSAPPAASTPFDDADDVD